MYTAMLTTLATTAALIAHAVAAPQWGNWQSYKYVIALSVDGMHSSDVGKYVALRPASTIAQLLNTGIEYQNAFTSAPSDSFPGTSAQYTGGTPLTTGIWYDDVWDASYYPAGSGCKGMAGAEVVYDESIDYNSTLLFSGGIDAAKLPLTLVNGKCTPVYPHDRIQVNTVFEVIKAAGLQNAYVDKHPSYGLLNGPSGTGLTTAYFPEIGAISTSSVAPVIKYDQLHVDAFLDYVNGITPANSTYGNLTVGKMPALFGGNFQAFSVAQKTVGYLANGSFSSNLTQAMDFVDNSIGQIVSKLKTKGYYNDTLLIIASKHGQAPINKSLLRKIDPEALMNATGVPTAFITTDDIGLVWLNNTADIPKAAANLQAQASALGIAEVIYGQAMIDQGFGNPTTSYRIPDLIVRVNLGVIYTTSKSKVAEHGGLSDDDRNVACIVSNPKMSKQVVTDRVYTRQVAPTILQALGLNPYSLQAVVAEGTKALPGIFSQ